jgi:hypothetical protein
MGTDGIVLLVLGGFFLLLGLFGLILSLREDEPGAVLLCGITAFGGGILMFASMHVPECNTKEVTSDAFTIEGKSYQVNKVKICSNGKIELKGKIKKDLPKVGIRS